MINIDVYKIYLPVLSSLVIAVIILAVIDESEFYQIFDDSLEGLSLGPVFNLLLLPFLLCIIPLSLLFMLITPDLAIILAPHATFAIYATLRIKFIPVAGGIHMAALIAASLALCIITLCCHFAAGESPHPIGSLFLSAIALLVGFIAAEFTNSILFYSRKRSQLDN